MLNLSLKLLIDSNDWITNSLFSLTTKAYFLCVTLLFFGHWSLKFFPHWYWTAIDPSNGFILLWSDPSHSMQLIFSFYWSSYTTLYHKTRSPEKDVFFTTRTKTGTLDACPASQMSPFLFFFHLHFCLCWERLVNKTNKAERGRGLIQGNIALKR